MKTKLGMPGWSRALMLASATGVLALTAADPALADYRRSCRAVLEIRPAGSSTAVEAYQWRVYNTVTFYAQVNEARREARRAIVSCVETHWGDADADAAPNACQTRGSLEFAGYPFTNLSSQLHDDICGASDEIRHDVDLVLFIDGERGCVVDGGNINPATRVDITSGYRINCPIPDGGSWECVGEGCASDEPEPEPEGEDRSGAPDTPPLPGVRLPGNDIGGAWTPGQSWEVCWQMCEDNAACRAWTFRAAGTTGAGSEAGCLLKSAVGEHVSDPCCQSGIKE